MLPFSTRVIWPVFIGEGHVSEQVIHPLRDGGVRLFVAGLLHDRD
jgi:hypothetical protein